VFLHIATLLLLLLLLGGHIPHRVINWAAASLVPKMIEESHAKCLAYPIERVEEMRKLHVPTISNNTHTESTKTKKKKKKSVKKEAK
jgi:sucrose-6-phosphate hydrolase SacC (GH32 family)